MNTKVTASEAATVASPSWSTSANGRSMQNTRTKVCVKKR